MPAILWFMTLNSNKEYAANVIAESMYAQVDANGYSHTMLDSIVDYKKSSDAVERADMFITTKNGTRRRRETTTGWDLLPLTSISIRLHVVP